MDHAANLAGIAAFNNIEGFLGRLAAVHDNRQFHFLSQLDLLDEPISLNITGRKIVVIVQTDLADGYDLFRAAGIVIQLVHILFFQILYRMGMHAHSAEYEIVFIHHLQGAGAALHIAGAVDDGIDTRTAHSAKKLLLILFKLRIIIMRMSIKVH